MKKYVNKIIQGDTLKVLKTLPDEIINCCVTSPPYWNLRDYNVEGQLGLEKTFEEYINKLCNIFDEVKRVLRKDGTCWVNLGDSYSGSGNGSNDYRNQNTKNYRKGITLYQGQKPGKTSISNKSLCLIPQRFAIEMVNRGWILRNTIIWHKPNCMPSSAKDRFTVDFEYLYFFVKSKKYWFEQQLEKATRDWSKSGGNIVGKGIHKKGGNFVDNGNGRDTSIERTNRNKRTVWKIPTKPFPDAHFAVFPEALIETPIQAGCPKGGIVLDPFMGAGTTAVVSLKQGKRYLGIELKQEYIDMANKRIKAIPLKLFK